MKRIFALLCLVAVGASIGCDGETPSADKDAQFKEDVHTVAKKPGARGGDDEKALQALKEVTRQSILAIDLAVVLYNTKVGKMPKDISDLTTPINDGDQGLLKAKDVNDAWGNAFEYKVDGRKYTIRSAGPDGQMNTEDDITN